MNGVAPERTARSGGNYYRCGDDDAQRSNDH